MRREERVTVQGPVKKQPDGMSDQTKWGWVGGDGPLIVGSLFRVSFSPRGKLFWFWVFGWFGPGGGGVRQIPPPPALDSHIPGLYPMNRDPPPVHPAPPFTWSVPPLSSGRTHWLPDLPTARDRLRSVMDALGVFHGFGLVAAVGILLELYLALGIGEPADSVNTPWRLMVGYVSANHLLYAVHHVLGTYSQSRTLKETAGVGPTIPQFGRVCCSGAHGGQRIRRRAMGERTPHPTPPFGVHMVAPNSPKKPHCEPQHTFLKVIATWRMSF